MGFSIFRFINMYIFLASLAIGFFSFIYSMEDKRIMVYPTKENIELIQYREKAEIVSLLQER